MNCFNPTLDGDPFVSHGLGTTIIATTAFRCRARLALRRQALLHISSGRRRLGRLRVLELVVIVVVISVLVARIHTKPVETVHLQMHRSHHRRRRSRKIHHRWWRRRRWWMRQRRGWQWL